MSLSSKPTTTCIGHFVHDDSRDSKPVMEDEEESWYAGETMLMYNDGEMPWVEREGIKVGDVRKYLVRLDTGTVLVHEWNGNDSHTKFMNDLVLAKNLEEIGLMFEQGYGELHMGFKHPVTLGDQTGVKSVWFSRV